MAIKFVTDVNTVRNTKGREVKIKLKQGACFVPKTPYNNWGLDKRMGCFMEHQQEIQMLNTDVEYEAKAVRLKDFGAGYLEVLEYEIRVYGEKLLVSKHDVSEVINRGE